MLEEWGETVTLYEAVYTSIGLTYGEGRMVKAFVEHYGGQELALGVGSADRADIAVYLADSVKLHDKIVRGDYEEYEVVHVAVFKVDESVVYCRALCKRMVG